MIAMIVLAGVCGVLITLVIVLCCCCQRYQRKLMGGGSGTRFGKHSVYTKEDSHWPVTAYDSWGATPYGSTTPYNPQNSGDHHRGHGSAYDWALPTPSRALGPASDPYSLAPRSQINLGSNDYGRVLLNPPSAVCSKPAMPSTKLGGHCGAGGGCDGKFYQSSGQALNSTAAQFVLESGATRHY